jgi:hypothetical protein
VATLRSDVIIPEVFTPYVIEQTTFRDAFLASGVVQPMAELNATEGGDYVNIPFWKANLTGDFEVLSDSTSLTPGKITADKQVGVILHRGRAFESHVTLQLWLLALTRWPPLAPRWLTMSPTNVKKT